MTKKTAIGLAVAMMLAGSALVMFELFLAATMHVSFVVGGGHHRWADGLSFARRVGANITCWSGGDQLSHCLFEVRRVLVTGS